MVVLFIKTKCSKHQQSFIILNAKKWVSNALSLLEKITSVYQNGDILNVTIFFTKVTIIFIKVTIIFTKVTIIFTNVTIFFTKWSKFKMSPFWYTPKITIFDLGSNEVQESMLLIPQRAVLLVVKKRKGDVDMTVVESRLSRHSVRATGGYASRTSLNAAVMD